jgi:GTPase SAR1 family protein
VNWVTLARVAARPLDRVVAWVSRRRLYSLVVLGPEAVGKSTLLNSWRGTWEEGQKYQPTQAMRPIGTARLKADGQRLMLPDLRDVSGRKTSYTVWEAQAQQAQIIIYLVNAEHLYNYERVGKFLEEWVRIKDDAGQIGRWLEKGNADRCIVAVTHRDKDSRFGELGEQPYLDLIEDQLEPVVNKLGGEGKVKIVTGSLDTRANAERLTDRIVEQL